MDVQGDKQVFIPRIICKYKTSRVNCAMGPWVHGSMGPWVRGSMGYLDWPYSYQINLHAVNEIMHGECLQFVMTNESIAKTGANSVKLYA